MSDNDRWEDDPYKSDRNDGRDRAPRRHDGPYASDRGFGQAPRIGPTGMISHSQTGDFGASGRYFEDEAGRADYGGFGGGMPGYAPGPGHRGSEHPYAGDGRAPPPTPRRVPHLEELERDAGGPYADYGRAAGGYGAGGGYTPTPSEGVPREARTWTDRAALDWEAAGLGLHRGRGPKGYKRSDERIREDVSDRLTDDPLLDASEIEVTVAGGEVTLNGTVAGRFAKRRAEDCADSVSGVGHVQNNLRVSHVPRPGTEGAETDPRIAAVSDGRDADEAARALTEERTAPGNSAYPQR